MRKLYFFSFHILVLVFLSSCKFQCSVGDIDKQGGEAKVIDGARVYNDIELEASGVKVEKAYLKLANGDPVPASNVVAFDQPVKLVIFVSEGWKEVNNRVNLGVSETILAPTGDTMLYEPDLFSNYPEGVSTQDSKTLTVTAKIIFKRKLEPLTTFNVKIRVWDKNSNSYINGSYKLYSK